MINIVLFFIFRLWLFIFVVLPLGIILGIIWIFGAGQSIIRIVHNIFIYLRRLRKKNAHTP